MSMIPMENSSTLYSYSFEYLFADLADPRVRNWFLMDNPFYMLSIVGFYLLFIFDIGPKFMKNRKPFELRSILVMYNLIQVLLSAYIMIEHLDSSWLRNYSWKCQPVDYSLSTHALRVAKGVHLYHIAKMTELFDTVFFILRKKYSQITFLHVYHHSMMAIVTWGITKYIAGGQITLIAVMNSFVHVVMYGYYMLAAVGPQMQKYLWWKKYITMLQLVQFVITLLHSIQVLFYDCGYPKSALVITIPNSLLFYFLFSNFYKSSYKCSRRNDSVVESTEIQKAE